MKLSLLTALLVIIALAVVLPVQAFAGQPPAAPQAQPTPGTGPVTAERSAPPWLGVLLVFIIPLVYMLVNSRGKSEPDSMPPSADLPVVHGDSRPFRTYEDEDEA